MAEDPRYPLSSQSLPRKGNFIEKDLRALVGDGAFWMDTLTVDQRNENEVLAIVQSIPTIFSMAQWTIAVRKSDGLYDCCIGL